MNQRIRIAVGIALILALVPGAAFASTTRLEVAAPVTSVEESIIPGSLSDSQPVGQQSEKAIGDAADGDAADGVVAQLRGSVIEHEAQAVRELEEAAALAAGNKLLAYDRADIDAIGTQEATGHTICCPSFSCAYADAVMDHTIHSHEYYTCSCCTWTDWGGGNSSYRCVGTDEQLLREAYDQIVSGRPTVIHVSASYGEHWIALIGIENATDPDHLTLGNFIALDPWDGVQINAASRFSLYGDGCEHISER